jgi:hypothetical protein
MSRAKDASIESLYGPQSKTDNILTRRCRLLQSWYRTNHLKQSACGAWRPGRKCVGSVLASGETTGANFISDVARKYASQKVAEKVTNPDLTIDEYRLYNNMLSSQPMCFNLFSDLRQGIIEGDENAAIIIRKMFVESGIERIGRIEVEMIPRPIADYIDDKTAFDAAIMFSSNGLNYLAAIETKYTDKLGTNRASDENIKKLLAENLKIFTPEGQDFYFTNGFDQVARNLLLTLAYSQKHQCTGAINYVLALEEDDEGRACVNLLRKRLNEKFRECIKFLSLQTVVARGLTVAGDRYASVLKDFHKRYLNLKVADEILAGA